MAVDASQERMNYVVGLQAVAKLVLQLNNAMNNLSNLYNGGGLSGSFLDAELATGGGTKHLAAADIGTYTANLNTVQTAMSTGVVQNMAKAVGTTI